jgi:hypothetical protein
MSRPQHLSVPNTPEGIRRINEEQELYDKDLIEWERREAAAIQEEQEREAEHKRQFGESFDNYLDGMAEICGTKRIERPQDCNPDDLPF